jgi:hypothetical protein
VTSDRDHTIDRLLRRRRPADEVPSASCLEPETIAAWLDGSLSSQDRTSAETHAASCSRCQAVLAAMARTEPVPERLAWWRGRAMRWFAPLALAEAALIAWLLVIPHRAVVPPPPDAATTVARVEPPPVPTPTAPAPAEPMRKAAPSDKRAFDEVSKEAKEAQPLRDRLDQSKAVMAAPPPAPPPAPEPTETHADNKRQVDTFAARAPMTRNESAKRIPIPIAPLVVFSPDRSSGWRVQPGGAIERTVDGGTTWVSHVDAAAGIRAGRSPSRDVVWLVGDEGVVLVSVDGRTWQRRNVGETVVLVDVAPVDAMTATVTAADGRKYSTQDGGVTWSHP